MLQKLKDALIDRRKWVGDEESGATALGSNENHLVALFLGLESSIWDFCFFPFGHFFDFLFFAGRMVPNMDREGGDGGHGGRGGAPREIIDLVMHTSTQVHRDSLGHNRDA